MKVSIERTFAFRLYDIILEIADPTDPDMPYEEELTIEKDLDTGKYTWDIPPSETLEEIMQLSGMNNLEFKEAIVLRLDKALEAAEAGDE